MYRTNMPFWFTTIDILFDRRFIFEIFPSKKYDINRKLNAVMRLSIVYSLILYLLKKEIYYLSIPLITGILTYLIWYRSIYNYKEELINNSFENKLDDLVQLNDINTECRIPNKDNPFMNPEITDFSSNKESPKSCPSYNNVGVQRRIEELFNEDLYRNVTDIFGKENSQRQFYTVPGNQVPHDQDSFAQWLYGVEDKTCKEAGGIACLGQTGNVGSGASGNPH